MVYFLSKYLALFLLKLFFRFRVKGQFSIPKEGPCVIVSNHSSYLDPIVIGCAAPRRVYFVAKEELFRNPLARFFLYQLGAFPLRRKEVDQVAVKRIFTLLRQGKVVCLFPEGTRNDGVIREFKPGVIKLLLKAKVPLVVAGIRGTYESFPRGARFPRPFPIQVAFSHLLLSSTVGELELSIHKEMEVLLGEGGKES
ncbi:MAG: lysophospholipid acyltransferase family protein [Atribacterota bacterium]